MEQQEKLRSSWENDSYLFFFFYFWLNEPAVLREGTFHIKCYTVGSIWVCGHLEAVGLHSGGTWGTKQWKKQLFERSAFTPWLLLLLGCLGAAGTDRQEHKMKPLCRHEGPRPKMSAAQSSRLSISDSFLRKSRPERAHSFGAFKPLSLSAARYKKRQQPNALIGVPSYFDSSAFGQKGSSRSKCLLSWSYAAFENYIDI